MHACKHTYIHCIHYIHTYIPYIHTYHTYILTYMHTYIHTDILTYRHTDIQTYIHTITLHYITVQYITLHTYILTLHYITLRYVALRYITLHYITYTHTYMHACMHTYIYHTDGHRVRTSEIFPHFLDSQLEPQKSSTVRTFFWQKVLIQGVTPTNYEGRIIFLQTSHLLSFQLGRSVAAMLANSNRHSLWTKCSVRDSKKWRKSNYMS